VCGSPDAEDLVIDESDVIPRKTFCWRRKSAARYWAHSMAILRSDAGRWPSDGTLVVFRPVFAGAQINFAGATALHSLPHAGGASFARNRSVLHATQMGATA